MKTKAIVIGVILFALLSSPVFAAGNHWFDVADGTWSDAGKWTGNPWNASVPDDTDMVYIAKVCDYDLVTGTIRFLYLDFAGASGVLNVGLGEKLIVDQNLRMGTFFGSAATLNLDGGTTAGTGGIVEVLGNDGDTGAALLLYIIGAGSDSVKVNITEGGVLKLHAAEDEQDGYCHVIDFDTDTTNNDADITISGTGSMELYPRTISSIEYIPAMRHTNNELIHTDDSPAGILVKDDGYIKYMGCNAMNMIAEDADDNGGVFRGEMGTRTLQMYEPNAVDVSTEAYEKNAEHGIAWFYDGTDTYLFPAVDMTTVDAGSSMPRYWTEGEGIFMEGSLDKAVSDVNDYTYAWECVPSGGVTYYPDNTVLDPNVHFPSPGVYTLQLTATSDEQSPYVVTDFVTIPVILYKKVMVTHLAIDEGELKAGHFADSSTEGDRNNHAMITDDNGSGWSGKQGVVGCGENDALYANDDGRLELHLDHTVADFNELAPSLDYIDAAVTVALWFKGERKENQYILEKVGSFRLFVERGGDLRSGIWTQGASYYKDTKSKDNGRSLGNDLDDDNLIINSDRQGVSGRDHNQWHHLAISYDSIDGRVRHYVDGVKIVEDNDKFGTDLIPDLADRRIAMYPGKAKLLVLGDRYGKYGHNQDFRRGALDDIRIYNYVLEDHEIAGLAAMGESVAMVYAGSSFTFDPNDVTWDPNYTPVIQLSGAYAKFGSGSDQISNDSYDNRIMWTKKSGPGTVTFANSNDPETTVSFSEPGVYTLRLNSFERLCGSSNDHFDSVTVTVLPAIDCEQVKDMGWNYAGDLNGDCVVDEEDLKLMAAQWLEVVAFP